MFFRPATQAETLPEILVEISKKTDQHFVLENHSGILGLVCFQEDKITIAYIKKEYYLEFLAMIEEFLFMKHTSIILLNPLKNIDLQKYKWQKHSEGMVKKKPSISDRKYCMDTSQTWGLL